jgi:hypothetical protein
VALGEAAAGHHGEVAALLLQLAELEQGVDRLLGGDLDEPAGVDDGDVRLLRGGGGVVAARLHEALDVGRVDGVLGAAQCLQEVAPARGHEPPTGSW